MLRRLFNPFEQGEQTIARRYGGLGLDLAISKGIVEPHGGRLAAHSAGREAGATFVLELAAVPAPAASGRPGGGPGASGRGPRVLLVEDHRDTLRVMAKLLRAMGYDVATASSVREALGLAEREAFDVLVSHIGLPDGTGHDLVRQLRARRPVRAIAVSGSARTRTGPGAARPGSPST